MFKFNNLSQLCQSIDSAIHRIPWP